MQKEPFNSRTAKQQIDLVGYLNALGRQPIKQNSSGFWFLSPLHEERTAPFKVDASKQIQYDHGTGQVGGLIDFIKAYTRCDFKEALTKLKGYLNIHGPTITETQQQNIADNDFIYTYADDHKHIKIITEHSIQKHCLKQYIHSRGISFSIASQYLKEVNYSLNEKTFTVLGFPNDAGGYELRNKYFKGSSRPKASTVIPLNEKQKRFSEQRLAVFEGFFSMLSFLEILENGMLHAEKPDSVLELNALAFLNKSQDLIMAYGNADLYLDNDTAGKKAMEQALCWSKNISDKSSLYDGLKDLNSYLCSQIPAPKQKEETVKSCGVRH